MISLKTASKASSRVRRVELPASLRHSVAQVMQYALLDEILSAKVWTPNDLVFQGGTSIHVVWNSPRFSEDLDFMISVERAGDIARVMERAAKGVRDRVAMTMPNCEVRLKAPIHEKEGVRSLIKYELVWSDPGTMGAVRVKAEFYTVAPEHLDAYRSEPRRHQPDAMMIATRPEIDYSMGELMVHSVIPAAHPESIYGDKLIALAKRPYMKARDFFDLWWLKTQLSVNIDNDDLYGVMRRSADCYLYSDEEILVGLNSLTMKPPNLAREIEKNLSAFLPQKLHSRMKTAGAFDDMYRHAMAEGQRLSLVITERLPPVITL